MVSESVKQVEELCMGRRRKGLGGHRGFQDDRPRSKQTSHGKTPTGTVVEKQSRRHALLVLTLQGTHEWIPLYAFIIMTAHAT